MSDQRPGQGAADKRHYVESERVFKINGKTAQRQQRLYIEEDAVRTTADGGVMKQEKQHFPKASVTMMK